MTKRVGKLAQEKLRVWYTKTKKTLVSLVYFLLKFFSADELTSDG